MGRRFFNFMMGRYGMYARGFDTLSRWLFYISLALMIAGLFMPHLSIAKLIINGLSLVLAGIVVFRFLSKNINARVHANMRFIRFTDSILIFLGIKTEGDKRIFRCPKCGKKVRVPKGKGKIRITCPSCKHEFLKKT